MTASRAVWRIASVTEGDEKPGGGLEAFARAVVSAVDVSAIVGRGNVAGEDSGTGGEFDGPS